MTWMGSMQPTRLVILSQFAFGMKVAFDDVAHKGIRNITPEERSCSSRTGYVVKLVGSIEELLQVLLQK